MKRGEQLLSKILSILGGQREGLKQAEIARAVGTHQEAVARALADAQKQGVLFQQDDRGRIKPME